MMNLIFDILFYAFLFFTAIQLFYYLFVFTRFAFYKAKPTAAFNLPVSVIVCAKNESENLVQNIPLLVAQEYPLFELVLIDDASSDGTLELFESYEKQYPNIKLVKVENNEAFWGNKKFALTLGIKAAKYEHLVFIDADCKPNSSHWLAEMAGSFNAQKSIVLGYGAYEKIKNSFVNTLIRFETVQVAMQYFSWALAKKPYMGVGRNLAYKKSEFFKVNGFINHMKLRSGDDDLFINEAANKNNTSIQVSEKSWTVSKPKKTFKKYIKQKRRHISTAKYYKTSDKIQLALFFISWVVMFILAFILLLFLHQWIIVASVLGFRYLIAWIVFGKSASKLKEKDVLWWFPFLEITLVIVQFRVFFTNLLFKPVHWK